MSTRTQRREAARLMPPEWREWRSRRRVVLGARIFFAVIAGVTWGRLLASYGWRAAGLSVWLLVAVAGVVLMKPPEFTIYVDNRSTEEDEQQ